MENFNDNSKDIGLNEIMLMNFVTPPQWSVICLVKGTMHFLGLYDNKELAQVVLDQFYKGDNNDQEQKYIHHIFKQPFTAGPKIKKSYKVPFQLCLQKM